MEKDLDLETVADLHAILSSTTRLFLVRLLGEGEKNVGELAESLGVTYSAASQHLTRLRRGGIVDGRRDAQRQIYCLVTPVNPVVSASLALLEGSL